MSLAYLVSHQEKIKVAPEEGEKQTLHERMCFLADSAVRHNFSDVAVHDARILKKMRCGEYRLWVITELGSHFLPLSCKMSERKKQEENGYSLSAVHVTITRMLRNDPLQQAQNQIVFRSAQFYLVGKGADNFSGTIEPMSFPDVVRFVFFGNYVEPNDSIAHLF